MPTKPALRVSNPPPKPLLIWDGECRFCALWVERWRQIAGSSADDAMSQEAAARYPEIPPELFERAIVYIDADGKVFTAAEAIFRSLRLRGWQRALAWTYDHIPAFAAVSEFCYRLTARNRQVSSTITRILWGSDLRSPRYHRTQRWFLRGLGVVYLSAFLSYWLQIDGLIGSGGVLPVGDFLELVREQLGSRAVHVLPTLCWLNHSDAFLHLLCGSGIVISIALIIGLVPIVCLILLFICYLSLTIAGQTFFHFQWDILLLETGFLALFFAPVRVWLHSRKQDSVPRLGLFLLKLLLFKLMFMSGVVKLTSGDDSWWNLTALDYHYWSQPLPTVFAWFADKDPEWFKKISVAFCLVVEIVVPFFIWAPRRIRLLSAGLLIGLQIVIAITGNYCFFNLLTIVLCLLLIDDRGIGRWPLFRVRPGSHRPAADATQELRSPSSRLLAWVQFAGALIVLIITLPLNGWHIYSAIEPDSDMPTSIAAIYEHVEPYQIASGYGLFRVMTKDRREIIIEGSSDGIDWTPYEFKWKPGDVNRVPGWCAPHQPRLDWQMWFAALGSPRERFWFERLISCLLENRPAVTKLLATNPFPTGAPRYIRARLFRYRFTSSEERDRTGAWWRREEIGEYLPTVSLK
ncbi:MAG TPA: lipase maturation factor family protein [Chthoniobacterales bacterium]